ncbi:MAG: prepilin-type N-terminal cleavage/methylation domain-containing protein [Pirellulaceae bacterium]|nr:prepilin-type N-terminal cleavage/methylation domain-containing protein [Pirellulaceae bacterium]
MRWATDQLQSPQLATAPPVRQAFTLVELMLVLAIVVMIGSIATPLVDGVMQRQKLRGAVDEVRLAWEGARLTALRTGQAQVFRCQLGSGTYQVEPWIQHDDINRVGDGATLNIGGAQVQTAIDNWGSTAAASDGQQVAVKQLDSSMTFLKCQVANDTRAFIAAQDGSLAAADATQPVVVFYPDGTTSTAELLLQSTVGEVGGIQMRGLTGHLRTLEVTRLEQSRR